MGFFQSAKAAFQSKVHEENLYGAVAIEMANGQISHGLYAKALAGTNGDEQKAKAHYIKLRVDMLKAELAATAEVFSEISSQQKNLQEKQLLEARQKEGQNSPHIFRRSDPDVCAIIHEKRISIVKGRKVEIAALSNNIKLGKCTLEDRIKLIEIAGGSVRWNDKRDASKGCKVSLEGFDRSFGDLGSLDKWLDHVLLKRMQMLID